MLQIEIQNFNSIQYLVRNLEQMPRNKALKEGFTQAALVFKRYARQNMHKLGTKRGNLKSSLTHHVYQPTARVPAVVGFNGKGAHAHLLDLGTVDRRTKKQLWKGTRYRGKGPATYFFTRAREEGEKEAMDAIVLGIHRAIDRINSR